MKEMLYITGQLPTRHLEDITRVCDCKTKYTLFNIHVKMTEVDINSHHYEKKGFESINLSQNQPVHWWRVGRCLEVQVLGDFQAL